MDRSRDRSNNEARQVHLKEPLHFRGGRSPIRTEPHLLYGSVTRNNDRGWCVQQFPRTLEVFGRDVNRERQVEIGDIFR